MPQGTSLQTLQLSTKPCEKFREQRLKKCRDQQTLVQNTAFSQSLSLSLWEGLLFYSAGEINTLCELLS